MRSLILICLEYLSTIFILVNIVLLILFLYQTEIEEALDKVCSYLPSDYKQECQDLVNQYTPEIIELLETLKPSQICQALKLCPSSAGEPDLSWPEPEEWSRA